MGDGLFPDFRVVIVGPQIDPDPGYFPSVFDVGEREGEVLEFVVIQFQRAQIGEGAGLPDAEAIGRIASIDPSGPNAECLFFQVAVGVDVIQREDGRLTQTCYFEVVVADDRGRRHVDPLRQTDAFADPHSGGIHEAQLVVLQRTVDVWPMVQCASFLPRVEIKVQLGKLALFQGQGIARRIQSLRLHDDEDTVFWRSIFEDDASDYATVVGSESNGMRGGVVEGLRRGIRTTGHDRAYFILVQHARGHILVHERGDVLGRENLFPGILLRVTRGVLSAIETELVDQVLIVNGVRPLQADLVREVALRGDDSIVEFIEVLPGIGNAALDVDEDGRSKEGILPAHQLHDPVFHCLAAPFCVSQRGVYVVDGIEVSVGILVYIEEELGVFIAVTPWVLGVVGGELPSFSRSDVFAVVPALEHHGSP